MPIKQKTPRKKIPEENGYRKELEELKKYVCDLQSNQIKFSAELDRSDTLRIADDNIQSGNLLLGYGMLIKLESAQFHLLSEAFSHKEDTSFLQKEIENGFEPMEESFAKLKKQVNYYCEKVIDIIRSKDEEPRRHLETVLGIAELDERIDFFYSSTNVPNRNRPHGWRKASLQTIAERICKRIDEFQVESRSVNGNWLTRYLETCRMFIIEDLCAAKHFLKIFPKEQQLYDHFVLFYHRGISKKLCEICGNELNKRELVQLLTWAGNYSNEQLLGMPFLQINAAALVEDYPLLPQKDLERLYNQFTEIIAKEVSDWTLKAIEKEFAEKESNMKENIEEDKYGNYYTQLPCILFSIICDQVAIAQKISNELVIRTLDACLSEFQKAVSYLERMITEFQNKNYNDKDHLAEFTTAMIAIANDIDICAESTEKLRKYIPEPLSGNKLKSASSGTLTEEPLISPPSSTSDPTGRKTKKLKHRYVSVKTAIFGAVNVLKDKAISKVKPSPSIESYPELRTEGLTPTENGDAEKSSEASLGRKSSLETNVEEFEEWNDFPIKNDLLARQCSVGEGSLATDAQTIKFAVLEKMDKLKESFNSVLTKVIVMLQDEVCDDLEEFFGQLLTKRWTKSTNAVETICMTILDYYADHKHLKPRVRLHLLMRLQCRVVAEYLISIASREITCTDYKKRCLIAEVLKKDVERIDQTFDPILKELPDDENAPKLTEVLTSIAEFISLRDKGMLSLEAASLLRKYPGMSDKLLFSIIDIRNDITPAESKAIASECFKIIEEKESREMFTQLFQMSKGKRKTSQIIKDAVPRIRRRVKLSIVPH